MSLSIQQGYTPLVKLVKIQKQEKSCFKPEKTSLLIAPSSCIFGFTRFILSTMTSNEIIYVLIAIVITSLGWGIYIQRLKSQYNILQNKHHHLFEDIEKEVVARGNGRQQDMQQTIVQLKEKIMLAKQEGIREGYRQAQSELSIKVFPYKNEFSIGDEGVFINDLVHHVQIGYQYQLFINNIPVLQPAIVIEEELFQERKKVEWKRVQEAMYIVTSKLISIASQSNGVISYLPEKK